MKKMKKTIGALLAVCLTLTLAACSSNSNSPSSNDGNAADSYPSENITLVVPWAAGGGTDLIGRQIAAQLESSLNTNIVVENVTGGSGAVGFKQATGSPADGYTICMTTSSLLLQKYANDTYVEYTDFDHVCIFNFDACGLIVSADAPYNTVEEFVEYAKANPGLTCANSGAGTMWHTCALQFSDLVGVEFTHVPYDSGNDACVAVAGGHADLTMVSVAEAASLLQAGQLKVLAIGLDERSEDFADIPTFIEQGYDLTGGVFRAFAVPAGTDEAIVEKLANAVKDVYDSDEFKTFMHNGGYGMLWMDGEELTSYLKDLDTTFSTLLSGLK